MADSRTLELILKLQDNASKELQGVTGQLDKLSPTFKKMAVAGTAGFAAITGAIALSVRETIEAEAAQNRLTHILKTSRGATDDQINSLLSQADALEKVGVVSKDAIVQSQAQLATFDLEAASIKRLTPAILDYVVAEKGANASTDDLKQLTNGLAQALQGNFGSLTKTGFVLDDATKELIKNGTETERTTALVSVLNSTYKGFNESARQTAEGSLVALNNEFNNLRESIGKAFLPIIEKLAVALTPILTKVAEWVEKNPKLVAAVAGAGLAISALVAGIGLLGLAIPAITVGLTGLGVAFTIATGPIGLITLAIAALVAGGVLLVKNWEKVKDFITKYWQEILIATTGPIGLIIVAIEKLIKNFDKVKSFGSGVVSSVGNFFSKISPFADGGIVTGPTLGLVGEAGPEAIIPLDRMGSMGGGTVINITVNGDISGKDLIETVKRGIMRDLGMNVRLAL